MTSESSEIVPPHSPVPTEDQSPECSQDASEQNLRNRTRPIQDEGDRTSNTSRQNNKKRKRPTRNEEDCTPEVLKQNSRKYRRPTLAEEDPSQDDDDDDEDVDDGDDKRFGAADKTFLDGLEPDSHHNINHSWVNAKGVKWPAAADRTVKDFMLRSRFFSVRKGDAGNAAMLQRLFKEIRAGAVIKGWVPKDNQLLWEKLVRKIVNVRSELMSAGLVIKRPDGEFAFVEKTVEAAEGSETLHRVLQDTAILSKSELVLVLKDTMRRIDDEKSIFRLLVSVMDDKESTNGNNSE